MVDRIPPAHERRIANERAWTAGRYAQSASPLDVSAVFELLSKRRRRNVLRCVRDATDGVVSLDELADRLRDRERDADDAGPDDSRERTVAALHHADLPKLAAFGVLEYDHRSRTVRYRDDAIPDACVELLEAPREE